MFFDSIGGIALAFLGGGLAAALFWAAEPSAAVSGRPGKTRGVNFAARSRFFAPPKSSLQGRITLTLPGRHFSVF